MKLLPQRLRRRKSEPTPLGPDKYGYDFADSRNRPLEPRGPGHVRDTAGTNAVTVAAWAFGLGAVGVFIWLAVWVFWFHT